MKPPTIVSTDSSHLSKKKRKERQLDQKYLDKLLLVSCKRKQSNETSTSPIRLARKFSSAL